MIKIIALGNTLMGDQGIAIEVIKHIKKDIISEEIALILGETDIEYCLQFIDEEDFLLIMDSTDLGSNPGEITLINLDSIEEEAYFNDYHYASKLITYLNIYKKNILGYFLGIKVEDKGYRMGLGKDLREIFQHICDRIRELIEFFRQAKAS